MGELVEMTLGRVTIFLMLCALTVAGGPDQAIQVSEKDGICTTVGGPDQGANCTFPFTFEGETFDGCTRTGDTIPWCSTLTDIEGLHVTGQDLAYYPWLEKWGHCPSSCHMATQRQPQTRPTSLYPVAPPCQDPPKLDHASLQLIGKGLGQYVCENGYQSTSNQPILLCQSDGTWNHILANLPSCVPINIECATFAHRVQELQCRTLQDTVDEQECYTAYDTVCQQVYEQVCQQVYDEACASAETHHGASGSRGANAAGTEDEPEAAPDCRQECKDVPRKECKNVPRQECSTVVRTEPRQECHNVTTCTKPECLVNTDCNNTLACGSDYNCYDPCIGSCGQNATCDVLSHTPVCTCPAMYMGDPLVGCIPERDYSDPCDPNPCAQGTQPLRVANQCKCFCPYQRKFGHFAECKPECVVSSDCPLDLSCDNYQCVDPCPGVCAFNAECHVSNHAPTCHCRPGYQGNAVERCELDSVIQKLHSVADSFLNQIQNSGFPGFGTPDYDDAEYGALAPADEYGSPQAPAYDAPAPSYDDTAPSYEEPLSSPPWPPKPSYRPPPPAPYQPPKPSYHAPPIKPAYAPPPKQVEKQQCWTVPRQNCWETRNGQVCETINEQKCETKYETIYPAPEDYYDAPAAPVMEDSYGAPAAPPYDSYEAAPIALEDTWGPPPHLQGCSLEWREGGGEYVTFTNKDEGDQVTTTLWIEPAAFKCAFTRMELRWDVTFEMKESESYKPVVKEIIHADGSITNETQLDSGVRPKTKAELNELNKTAINGGTIILKRWRAYDINVTAKWNKQEASETFDHDTFQWSCQDENETSISQKQFCNGKDDCPNAKDEDESVCKASDLSKKLSYVLSYPLMLAIILGYFLLPKLRKNPSKSKTVAKIKAECGLRKEDKETATRKAAFLADYKAAHCCAPEMAIKVEGVKFEFSRSTSGKHQSELSLWVQQAEEELHPDPDQLYHCVLTQYRACHPLAARIADPQGGVMLRLAGVFNSAIAWSFIMLCQHIFDYVRDIDISSVIYHFDTTVLQHAYQQYNNFNFFFLFLTSVGLLLISHLLNALYWILVRNLREMEVLRMHHGSSGLRRALYRHLPLVPGALPVLIFCRQTEIGLALQGEHVGQGTWAALAEESVLLQRMANDVKMIETVSELFGQLVIQILLLIKFTRLLKGDDVKLTLLGISFMTYMIITISISIIFMLPALLQYHKRNRENLRPITSVATSLLLVTWIMIIVTKVSVYIVGFQNTPGFLFVPIIVHMAVSYTSLNRFETHFRSLQHHDQLVYVLVSFLVPVSLPNKQTKSMKNGYSLALLLFFTECTAILIFAVIMSNFYSNDGFKEAFGQFPELIKINHIVGGFNNLCAMMFLQVVVVTVLSAALLVLYSQYFHPSSKLFTGQTTKSEEVNTGEKKMEDTEDSTAPTWMNIESGLEMIDKQR